MNTVYPIMHGHCGGVAFYYTEYPEAGTVISASKARYSSSRLAQPHDGGPMVCQSCEKPISVVNGASYDLVANQPVAGFG